MSETWFITVHSKHWSAPGGHYFVFDMFPYNSLLRTGPYGDSNENIGYWKKGQTNDSLRNHTRITGTEFREKYFLPTPIRKLLDF